MMTAMEYETISHGAARVTYPCLSTTLDAWTRDYGANGFVVQRSVELDGPHRRVKLITADRSFAVTAFVDMLTDHVELWV